MNRQLINHAANVAIHATATRREATTTRQHRSN
jgi:hypothetical protein